MEQHQCKECQYFLQHYTLNKRKIFRICCGHCTLDRIRRKLPDARACAQFAAGLAQEDAFVSKEYLSKELLSYMLHLELLPNIEDNKERIIPFQQR